MLVTSGFYLPLVDDFKLDSFGLDDSLEASVSAVDVEFESLFKLRAAGAFYCACFVPLSLLLHTYQTNEYIKHIWIQRELPTLQSVSGKDSYGTWKRKLKLHTGIQIAG